MDQETQGQENTEVISQSSEIIQSQNKSSADKPWLFKPGQSGNPGGRPKKLSNLLEVELMKTDHSGNSNAAKMIAAAVRRGIEKSDRMIELIFDRYEGRMPADQPTGPTIIVINGSLNE